MKKLIILIILAVGGYFAYQYYVDSSQQASSSKSTSSYNTVLSLPEKCQKEGETLQKAFTRHKKGEIKKVTLNGYTSQFRRCLKTTGYTDAQVDEAYDSIKN